MALDEDSQREFSKLVRKTGGRRSKYRNKIVTIGDRRFHSKAEAARWVILQEWEKKRIISQLRCQVTYQFQCGVKYVADFVYMEKGRIVVEDCKGVITKDYAIKRKMMRHEFGIEIAETHIRSKAADAILAGYFSAAQG